MGNPAFDLSKPFEISGNPRPRDMLPLSELAIEQVRRMEAEVPLSGLKAVLERVMLAAGELQKRIAEQESSVANITTKIDEGVAGLVSHVPECDDPEGLVRSAIDTHAQSLISLGLISIQTPESNSELDQLATWLEQMPARAAPAPRARRGRRSNAEIKAQAEMAAQGVDPEPVARQEPASSDNKMTASEPTEASVADGEDAAAPEAASEPEAATVPEVVADPEDAAAPEAVSEPEAVTAPEPEESETDRAFREANERLGDDEPESDTFPAPGFDGESDTFSDHEAMDAAFVTETGRDEDGADSKPLPSDPHWLAGMDSDGSVSADETHEHGDGSTEETARPESDAPVVSAPVPGRGPLRGPPPRPLRPIINRRPN